MNADSFIKGMQRANANRLRRQVQQQQANAVNNKPASIKPVLAEPSPAPAASPVIDLEAFRLDIIRKAIARIIFNKQKEINK